jgi:hypothetical protein
MKKLIHKKEKKAVFSARIPVWMINEIKLLKKKHNFTMEEFTREAFISALTELKKTLKN